MGWFLEEDRSGCRCFYFSESEMVTRDDADVLCAYHDGSWVAELDHPGINYWLKSQLLDITDVGQYEQFWLGVRSTERHSEGNCQLVRLGRWAAKQSTRTILPGY